MKIPLVHWLLCYCFGNIVHVAIVVDRNWVVIEPFIDGSKEHFENVSVRWFVINEVSGEYK